MAVSTFSLLRLLVYIVCYHSSTTAAKGMKVKVPYKREFGTKTVNPHNFTFIHQPSPCELNHSLLITVHSATQNLGKRMVIRNTWGNPLILQQSLPQGYRSKLVFVIGSPSNQPQVQQQIDYESEIYNDIVQANFVDHYRNNTYKAIYNMKWASSRQGCPKVNLIIKSDDDIMFNLKKAQPFWTTLQTGAKTSLQAEKPFIAGNLFGGGPRRNPKDKWYISVAQFKYDEYPPWFQGMVYMLTPCVARKIYEYSFTTPYLFTDDVYVGIASDRVEGIHRINLAKFYNNAFSSVAKNANYWIHKGATFYHNKNVREMYKLWYLTCSTFTCISHLPAFEFTG